MADLQAKESHPLRWPDNVGRTLLNDRLDQRQWKKQSSVYVKQVAHELQLLGAAIVEITYNEGDLAKKDSGVAIWYSRQRSKDTSWQRVLQIDNPNPDRAEIDKAFKRLVMANKCHPDQIAGGSGGDVRLYVKLEDAWRNAKAYLEGDNAYELRNCVPMDRYIEIRQNLAAAKLYLSHWRAMMRLGNPSTVERTMDRGFHAALTTGAGAI
jgi:hypothetical protein